MDIYRQIDIRSHKYMHTYTLTCSDRYAYTLTCSDRYAYTLTYINKHTHVYKRTDGHTSRRAYTRADRHICTDR